MTDTTPTQSTRLHTATVVLSSLIIALPMLFGKLVEAAIDAANPAKVDVSQDLAYLREVLGFGFGFLGLLLLVVAAFIVTLYRRNRRFSAIALPVIVLVVQLAVGLLLLLMTGVVNGIEDAYSSTLV
jgi:O-antigen/teichoic acid export membrane protein